MVTPREFKESFIKSTDTIFALWFQHTVENAPKTSLFRGSKQCFSVPLTDIPSGFVQFDGHLYGRNKEIVNKFGWEITYSPISEHSNDSGTKITFHWTDEEVDTPENRANYEKEYKYLAFNSTMWKYGHTDMSKFNNWFNKVADEHRNDLSYNELVYCSLIIPYDEIKEANASFVEDYTCKYEEYEYYETTATCEEKELKTSTLKKPYVEHLKYLGWKVKSLYFDKKYCLICC